MKKIILTILILSLTGHFANAKEYVHVMDEVMQSWKNEKLDDLIDHWGYPDSETTIANRHIFVWSNGYTLYPNGVAINSVNAYGVFCKRVVEVNNDNIIIGAEWSGAACPGIHSDYSYKKWVHPDKSYSA